ncbi:uncharacterized protein LOC123989034 [Osmia bicornis bicornis]|uniref:uncharacterized protein LOC123989034 n=1 Tax=Osmia bicornis bicornis TaxID=1437191 RepID=UPI001EAF1BEC|nr:uncharacterized protein LOC123989034 [Osmia bicornis bicornis]
MRSVPDRRQFQRLDHRFSEASLSDASNNHRHAGRPRTHWRTEEQVIALARTYPFMGFRGIARRVNISHMTVHRVIREEGLRPYRIQKVQALRESDYQQRTNFCQWMLRKVENNEDFFKNIIFTDESSFSNTNIKNRQNTRIWAERNPHVMQQHFNQGRFSVNV